MEEDDEEVGYRKPPKKNRFKKGSSGNPSGRPRREKPLNDLRSIIERAANEEIGVNGIIMTMREVEIRSLQRKAAKGDVASSRHLAKMREQEGCDKPARGAGGVLLLPADVPLDEWEAASARQQAPYRGGGGDKG